MACSDPEKQAAAMLAAVEARYCPVVETRDPKGMVVFDIVKPPFEPDRQGWKVVSWGEKGTPGRPKRYVREQRKLERAIHEAVTKNPRQRSVDAITRHLIKARAAYHDDSFHTLRKRVDTLIKQWAASWDLAELYELIGTKPPVKPDRELLRELGLQSLQYFERPFGGRVICQ